MCTGKGACHDPICFVSNIQEVVAGQAVNTSMTGTEEEYIIVSYGKCDFDCDGRDSYGNYFIRER